MHEQIKQIRELLKQDDMHKAYDLMIGLNRFNEKVDNYTVFFINSLDVDKRYIEDDVEIDEENGSILVESVLGGYILAKADDIEDTLKEIEEKNKLIRRGM